MSAKKVEAEVLCPWLATIDQVVFVRALESQRLASLLYEVWRAADDQERAELGRRVKAALEFWNIHPSYWGDKKDVAVPGEPDGGPATRCFAIEELPGRTCSRGTSPCHVDHEALEDPGFARSALAALRVFEQRVVEASTKPSDANRHDLELARSMVHEHIAKPLLVRTFEPKEAELEAMREALGRQAQKIKELEFQRDTLREDLAAERKVSRDLLAEVDQLVGIVARAQDRSGIPDYDWPVFESNHAVVFIDDHERRFDVPLVKGDSPLVAAKLIAKNLERMKKR